MTLHQKTYAGLVSATYAIETARDAIKDIDLLEEGERAANMRAAISKFGEAMETLSDTGGDLAKLGFSLGMTKKALAEAWGIPADTFRGMPKDERPF